MSIKFSSIPHPPKRKQKTPKNLTNEENKKHKTKQIIKSHEKSPGKPAVQ
jgi:hypothetical protein